MAIWQVSLSLVNGCKKILFSDPVFVSSLEKLEKTFPEVKSWCETLKQYGELESTCIEIDVFNNDDIAVRIDLRNICKNQLDVLCEFALYNNLSIKYNDELYDASIDQFMEIFRKSEAYKFLLDSKNFLKEIHDQSGDS